MKKVVKKNTKILIIIILSVVLVGLGIFIYYKLSRDVEVKLIGNEIVSISVGSSYSDAGFMVTNNNKEVDKEKIEYTTHNTVDEDNIGEYKITYEIEYAGKTYELERTVSIIDDIPPVLTVNLDTILKDYCTRKNKNELEYSAIDNYDGDITDKIEVEEIDSKITLKVADSSGNEAVKEVDVSLSSKPKSVLKLNGNSTIKVALNGIYNEQGASYQDGCGNIINKNITISGEVDTSREGEYTITYTYNNETIKRKIIVYIPTNNSDKVIYLTFDDGPGAYTRKILDTLAKYNVKATFFVTHQFANYIPLLADEYNEGHTVAVHTYTHKYDVVYQSFDAYLNDFNKMNDVILEYTGTRSSLFRFPGGSSNTISRHYGTGIVSEVANKMTELGYVYFDWNVSSNDAGGANSTQIYNNVVNGVESCKNCVVLMHDIKLTTANALDNILNTLTNKGYQFAALSVDSPTAHHRINN